MVRIAPVAPDRFLDSAHGLGRDVPDGIAEPGVGGWGCPDQFEQGECKRRLLDDSVATLGTPSSPLRNGLQPVTKERASVIRFID
jgi:hypothetical protein